jgi:hypothetical protein
VRPHPSRDESAILRRVTARNKIAEALAQDGRQVGDPEAYVLILDHQERKSSFRIAYSSRSSNLPHFITAWRRWPS